jgi:RNA polymerase sigma factor (sigma-70 family)
MTGGFVTRDPKKGLQTRRGAIPGQSGERSLGHPETGKLLARYAELVTSMDMDALHDLIANRGLDILASGLPYFLLKAHLAQAADARRRDGRRASLLRRYEPDARELQAGSAVGSPEETAAAREQLELALARLPPADALILLWFAEGRSHKDIAERLGLTEVTLRQRVARARRLLRHTFRSDSSFET